MSQSSQPKSHRACAHKKVKITDEFKVIDIKGHRVVQLFFFLRLNALRSRTHFIHHQNTTENMMYEWLFERSCARFSREIQTNKKNNGVFS